MIKARLGCHGDATIFANPAQRTSRSHAHRGCLWPRWSPGRGCVAASYAATDLMSTDGSAA